MKDEIERTRIVFQIPGPYGLSTSSTCKSFMQREAKNTVNTNRIEADVTS
jgi:hypothetical protein